MRRVWIAWWAAGSVACGGNVFTSVPGTSESDASTLRDAALAVEAGPEAEPPDGAATCQTQLDCRRKDDCPGALVCCISPVPLDGGTCTHPHAVAQCRDGAACVPPGNYVLCDPNLGGCGPVLTCKQDAATLQSLGLPAPPSDFGVCGT